MDQAIKLKPDLAEAYSNRGFTLFSMGREKEALKSLRKAYELNPKIAEINNNLGVALDHFGKQKEAIKYFQNAVKMKSDYAEAQYNLACSLMEIGERDQAYAQLKLLEINDFEIAERLRNVIRGKYVIDASKQ